MNPITCIITDDEPMARKGLQGYVEKVDFLRLEGVFEDAMSLNTYLHSHRVDLLLLDIEMPYLSGLDLLQSLTQPPKVIFTTAYERYALKGYELDVVDYLLKPISFNRFLKAVNKVHQLISTERAPQPDKPSSIETGLPEHLFVKTDNKLEKVILEDILYLEAMENYVAIHTTKGKMMTHATLKSVIEALPPAAFLQVHKSYVVHLNKITHLEAGSIGIGKASIPISRTLKEGVMEIIVKNKLL
jgi:DNA-binding LytR/AlgR family response regulator